MKLRTSFFNPTALRKDITRFAPLWGLYTVVVLIYLMLVWTIDDTVHHRMNNLPNLMTGMAFVNLIYAGINAMMLFSDLYKSRLCNALHAMPLRREGWFLTHMISGLLFCIVPNLLGAAIGAALLGEFAYGAALWLGLMVLEYTVFFGIGVFSAVCAGTKLGMAAIYCLINFLAVLVAWLISTFYEPLLYGITVDLHIFARFCPFLRMLDLDFLKTEYVRQYSKTFLQSIPAESWLELGIWAAGSLGLSGVSLLIYRKRDLERAGDMITFQPAAPVFLVLYTFLIAAVVFYITYEVSGAWGYLFLAIGVAVGFFTGRMLMEKRVHVFRLKNFLKFGIFVAVFVVTLVLAAVDPFGTTRYVPKAADVKSVSICPYQSTYYMDVYNFSLTEEKDIQSVIDVHEDALDLRFGGYSIDEHVTIRYTLKDGRTVTRDYDFPDNHAARQTLQSIYSRPEYVLQNYKPDYLLNRLYSIEFCPYDNGIPYVQICKPGVDTELLDKFGDEKVLQFEVDGNFNESELATGLLDAVLADCNAGNLSQHNSRVNTVGYLQLQWINGRTETLRIDILVTSQNTIAYLKGLKPNKGKGE